MLWSIANARRLVEVDLGFYFAKNNPRLYYTSIDFLDVIDCCSHVRSVALSGEFMQSRNRGIRTKEGWKAKAARIRERTPATIKIAIDRALYGPSSSSLFGPTGKRSQSSLTQSLSIRIHGMAEEDFLGLVSRCPRLEELNVDQVIRQIAIGPLAWTTFAEVCPQLRRLRIQDCVLRQSPPSVPNLLSLFPSLQEITVHPSTFPDREGWPLFDFCRLNPGPNLYGPQQQQHPEQRPQLIHIDLVGSFKNPFEVLLQVLIQFPGLESIKIGRIGERFSKQPSYDLNVHKKPWLCLGTLAHLDLNWMPDEYIHDMGWFYQQLQTLERLTSLVLPMEHVRWAYRRRRIRDPVFYFHSVTRFRIGIDRYMDWSTARQITYEEAVFVVESAPSLKSLTLHLNIQEHCCRRLKSTYPRLLVEERTWWQDKNIK